MLRAQRVAAEAREDAAKGRALDEEEASRDLLCCCLMLQTHSVFGCCMSCFGSRYFPSSVSRRLLFASRWAMLDVLFSSSLLSLSILSSAPRASFSRFNNERARPLMGQLPRFWLILLSLTRLTPDERVQAPNIGADKGHHGASQQHVRGRLRRAAPSDTGEPTAPRKACCRQETIKRHFCVWFTAVCIPTDVPYWLFIFNIALSSGCLQQPCCFFFSFGMLTLYGPWPTLFPAKRLRMRDAGRMPVLSAMTTRKLACCCKMVLHRLSGRVPFSSPLCWIRL